MHVVSAAAQAARRLGIQRQSSLYRTIARNYWGIRSMWGERYYSQFGEDVALIDILRGATRGTYLDIGAGHPVQGSNTYALYRLGWNGTLIEPLAHHRVATRLLRPRDRLIHCLCGSESGEVTLFEYEPWQLSTISAEAVARLSLEGFEPVARHKLPMTTLPALGVSATPETPSLLSLDVEGAEEAVLSVNDWSSYTPAVICIEQWDSPISDGNRVRLSLESRGYELTNFIGNSGIYVHSAWMAQRL